jgi:hypothetical protein
MPVRRYEQNFGIPCKRLSAGDYAVLCNAVSSYDWPWIHNGTSVEAAVDRSNAAETQAIDSTVPSGHVQERQYPARVSAKSKT